MSEHTNPTAAALADDAACAAAIGGIGALDVQLTRIEATKASQVAAAAKEAEDRAAPLQAERAALVGQVSGYAVANRVRLTENHKSKTVKFPTGEVSWAAGRGRVVIDPALKAKVLDRLKKLTGFTRTKVEPDVTAIGKSLREDDKSPLRRIPGLSLEGTGEQLTVKPVSAELVEPR